MFFPRLVHAGFPLEDLDERTEIEATDQRPIVFTAGTANHHGKRFFERAAHACAQLNHPGILLSTHNENFPKLLPKLVSTHNYLSLRSLLPACGAIVHHGGIGTTSQALAAATPQIITPMAFDQFDNATRVAKLGCGIWLRRDRELITALSACLEGEHDEACKQAAARIEATPAAKIAAAEIKRLGTRG